MPVETVHADNLKDASRSVRLSSPTWQQVAKLIEQLDGYARTTVTLSSRLGAKLIITGGPLGYLCHLQDKARVVTLLNPDGSEDELGRVVGLEEAEIPHTLINPRAAVLKAARTFFQDASLDSSLTWSQ